MQPVQGYQLAYYYEPQTTCCQTTIGAPVAAPPAPGAVAVPLQQVVPQQQAAPLQQVAPANPGVAAPPTVGEQRQLAVPPGVGEQRQLAVPPGVSEQREAAPSTSESQRYPAPASTQPMPRAPEGASFRPSTAYPPPAVRLDRIVSASGPSVQGQVVSEDRHPVANVQLLFINADQVNTRETITADAAGKFQVNLAAGSWHVYTQTRDGKTEYRSKIDVRANEANDVRLVSR